MSPVRHALSDSDRELLARWRGKRFGWSFVGTIDDEGEVVFVDGGFELRVPAGAGRVPILDDGARMALEEHVLEYERTREVYAR
jgi:hypothetical protein